MSKISRDLFLQSISDKQAGFLGAIGKGIATGARTAWKGIKSWANKGIANESKAWLKNNGTEMTTKLQDQVKNLVKSGELTRGKSKQWVANTLKDKADFHGKLNWGLQTAGKGAAVVGGTAMIGKGLFGDTQQGDSSNQPYRSPWQGNGNNNYRW